VSDVEGAGRVGRRSAVSGRAHEDSRQTPDGFSGVANDPHDGRINDFDRRRAFDDNSVGRDEHGTGIMVRQRIGLRRGNGRCRSGLVLIVVVMVVPAGAVVMAAGVVTVCGGREGVDVRPGGMVRGSVFAVGVPDRGCLAQQQPRQQEQ
jgi:hypothetical protein